MARVAVLHQHTNNFGDDAAGSALVDRLLATGGADDIDVFYIWHRNSGGLPSGDGRVSHHQPSLLAGTSDHRPRLAVMAALAALNPKLVRGEMARVVRVCSAADATYIAPAGSNIGIYKDWMYLLSIFILVRSGVRPVFCQNTIAASTSTPFNKLASWVLKRSTVFVREKRSQDYLSSIGVQSSLGVDTALMLRPATPRPLTEKYLTIVPTRLSNWHAHHRELNDETLLLTTIPDAVSSVARESGLHVHLLAHLYGSESEAELLSQMAHALQDRGCRTSIVRPSSYEEYAEDLAGATAVLSMRYHGLVLSGQAATPCVPLSYEHKMREAAGYLGLEDMLLDVAHASEADITARLLTAIDFSEERVSSLSARAEHLRLVASGPILDRAAMAVREK